jgi:hypothetical protein
MAGGVKFRAAWAFVLISCERFDIKIKLPVSHGLENIVAEQEPLDGDPGV